MNNKLTYTNYGNVKYTSDNEITIECPVDVFEKLCENPRVLDYRLQCKKKMFKISFSESVELPEYKYLNRGFLIC